MAASHTRSPYDPTTMLAMSMHASPGVYALLVGSGISRSSGVGTGWDITKALATRQAAVALGREPEPEFNVEEWWAGTYPDVELGYSAVLGSSGLTQADRKKLLEEFFTPTDEDLIAGRKTPAPAHKAIARLVKRGTVRVIVTTNFDDLIEKALDEIGALYQVIASPEAIAGSEPLCHSACTVIKVHGDFKRVDVLNTEEELEKYHEDLDRLLDQVFDDYGLVTCGWSAEWDTALVSAITRAPSRRYPLYWGTRGALGQRASELVGARKGTTIDIADADSFLNLLVERLEILDRMANPPLTQDMAIGQLKRYIPDPLRRLDLRDLFDDEIERIRSVLHERPLRPAHPVPWKVDLDELADHAELLMHLVANGITFDTEHRHDNLWVWVVEQLLRARRVPRDGEAVNGQWVRQAAVPAFLVLKAASFAAIAGGRDDLFLRLHLQPNGSDRGHYDLVKQMELREVPAWRVLYEYRLFEDASYEALTTENAKLPTSMLARRRLSGVFAPLLRDDRSFEVLADRVEYRVGLLQQHFGKPGTWAPAVESLRATWRDSFDPWSYQDDFNHNADVEAWATALSISKDALQSVQDGLKEFVFQNKIL
ncbi:SIR2 family protein [Rhodococcus pyridinivorans]|uniref:SIR2 family protein n=1 Tax=Rhodococcus pyridinivorans TaxID=103816 RepID=UPI00190503E0|nr:SIR2 family protein [Rhodococcus pyridinivorans]QQM55681.1 SIR2 family protein [Rhodococcus pyridinivorans]